MLNFIENNLLSLIHPTYHIDMTWKLTKYIPLFDDVLVPFLGLLGCNSHYQEESFVTDCKYDLMKLLESLLVSWAIVWYSNSVVDIQKSKNYKLGK